MADILDKITAYKREEVARAKTLKPLRVISEYARSAPRVRSFASAIEAIGRNVDQKNDLAHQFAGLDQREERPERRLRRHQRAEARAQQDRTAADRQARLPPHGVRSAHAAATAPELSSASA